MVQCEWTDQILQGQVINRLRRQREVSSDLARE